MRRLIVFMHTSLDGFVGGPKGEMDWIHVDDDLFDFAGKFTDGADAALYGRVTYQMMESYWPTAADLPNANKHDIEHSRWYNRVAKVVLSKTLEQSGLQNTTVLSADIPEHVNKLKQEPGRNILIFGSPTAVHTLTQHNLIDDYWLFVNPVLLGKGIPMFPEMKERVPLVLRETKNFSPGVVGLHYETTINI